MHPLWHSNAQRVLTVVGETLWCKQAALVDVICARMSDQEGQCKYQLEVSQDTNCSWQDIIEQANWAWDVMQACIAGCGEVKWGLAKSYKS